MTRLPTFTSLFLSRTRVLVYACNPSLAKLQNFTLLIRSIFMAFYSVLAIVLPQHLHIRSCPILAVKTDRPPRLVEDIKHIPLSILYNKHACLGVFLYIYLDGVFVRKLVFLATAPFGFSTEHTVLELLLSGKPFPHIKVKG